MEEKQEPEQEFITLSSINSADELKNLFAHHVATQERQLPKLSETKKFTEHCDYINLKIAETFKGNQFDPDVFLKEVQNNFTNVKLSWNWGKFPYSCLMVNRTKTKIYVGDIQDAIQGLSKVTSNKHAIKIVTNIVTRTLKNIF